MFDKYIEDTVQGVIKSFDEVAEGNYSFTKLISTSSLAEQYKNFFEAELNWWIFAEVSDLVNSEHFDYTSTSFFSANLDDELRSAAFITPYKLNEFVEFAVTTRLNFLCRPQFTLQNFVFNGKDSISCDEALMRMNYFSDYHYFKKEIKNWLITQQENEVDFISREIFSEQVGEIEYQYVLNLSSDEFVNLLEPMYDFFNTKIEGSEDLLVPTEALMIFFEDKNIKPLVKILERKYTSQDVKLISKEALYNFINEMIEVTENDEFEEDLVETLVSVNDEIETNLNPEEEIAEDELQVNEFEEITDSFETIAEEETIEDGIDLEEEITDEFDYDAIELEDMSGLESESEEQEIIELVEEESINASQGIDLDTNLDEIENLLSANENTQMQEYSDDFDIESEMNSLNASNEENNNTMPKANPALRNLNAIQSINSELESFVGNDDDEEDITSQFSSLEEMLESRYEDNSNESLDELISEIKELEQISEGEIVIPETTENIDINSLDDYTKDIENLIN